MHLPHKRPTASFLFLAYLCALGIGILAIWLARSCQSGFSGADEPSHFLNGYFIADYLSHHLGGNPMAAATEFYVHYPKISISHWPPAYYGLLGLLFMVLPPTMPVAFAINALVAALPAVGIGAALAMLVVVMAVPGIRHLAERPPKPTWASHGWPPNWRRATSRR